MTEMKKPCQLTFFMIVLLSSSRICGAVPGCVAKVSPPDPFLFEGETLTLTCGLTTACHKPNASLHFTYIPPDDSLRHCGNIHRIISGSNRNLADFVTRLNGSHIRLVVPKVTVEDSGDYCCVESPNGSCFDRLAKEIVTVEYNLKKVTKMSCVNQDWLHLNCSSIDKVTYLCPELIKVKPTYTCSFNGDVINGNCTVGFKVTHERRGDRAKESNFTIITYDYVKPNRVKDLRVIAVNSTCVNISWDVNTTRVLRDLKFIIRYKTLGKWITSITNLKSKTTIVNWTQCNLQPYTNYTFRVVVRPEFKGYESEPADHQVQTLEDLPTAAPETCRGCFHQFPCTANMSQQCVTVYWKDIPETKKRGPIRYIVELNNAVIQTTKTWYTFKDLENSTSDRSVVISPATTLGRGLKNRTVTLFYKRPNPPENLVVEENGTDTKAYLLSWRDSNRNTESYKIMTFVWCYKKSIVGGEEGCEINWKRVNTSEMSHTLSFGVNTSRIIEDSGISIGVSSAVIFPGDVESRSSGIVWSSCIYRYNQPPKKPPTLLHTKGPTVSWEIEPCPNAYITGFSITSCQTLDERTCQGSPKLVNVSGSVREYQLRDIALDTKYLVYIEAWSRNGRSAKSNSTVVLLYASQKGDTSWYTMAVVLTFLIFFAVISSFIWCCYKSRKRTRRMFDSTEAIKVKVNNNKKHDLPNLLKNFLFCEKKAPSKRDNLCLDTSSDSAAPLLNSPEIINVLKNELEQKQIIGSGVMKMQNFASKDQEYQNERGNEMSDREQNNCAHVLSNTSQETGLVDKSSNNSYMRCIQLWPVVQDTFVGDSDRDTLKGVSDTNIVHEAELGVSEDDSGHDVQICVTGPGSRDVTQNCVSDTDSGHEANSVVSDTDSCHEIQICVTGTGSCDATQNCVSDTDSGHGAQNDVSDTETCRDKQNRESHYADSGEDNEKCDPFVKNSLRTIDVTDTSEFIKAEKEVHSTIPSPGVNACVKNTPCSSIASIIVSEENPEYVRVNFSDSANT